MENLNQVGQQQDIEAIVKSIVGDVKKEDFIEVDLTSKCYSYKFTDGGNKVKIRPMSFSDERIILSNINGKDSAISKLMSLCVLNINPNNLFIFDKLFLLLKIREISFGDEYSSSVSCENCKKDNQISIKIPNLLINYVEDNFVDPKDITLPVSKKIAKVRSPRVYDEQYLSTFDKTSSNLWRFVTSIDGQTNPVVIGKVIDRIHIKDANTLLKTVTNPPYGVVPSVRMECSECSHVSTLGLPIGPDFFIGS
jgi:hypothetical protein